MWRKTHRIQIGLRYGSSVMNMRCKLVKARRVSSAALARQHRPKAANARLKDLALLYRSINGRMRGFRRIWNGAARTTLARPKGCLVRNSKSDPTLISTLVQDGLSDLEIANRMGWTVGTLRVRCSQLKISLRRKNINSRQFVLPQTIFDELQQRAAMMGVSTSALAAELLHAIVRDGLYNAVLDRDDNGAMRPNVSLFTLKT
jgi:hypothetical protein